MEPEQTEFWRIWRDDRLSAIRLCWKAASARMDGDGFRTALDRLASHAEETSNADACAAICIDVRDLKYRPTRADSAWRDTHIAPRYNRAGVKRLAYVVAHAAQDGDVAAPAPGGDIPARRPGDDFLTRFCASEDDAAAWLAGA